MPRLPRTFTRALTLVLMVCAMMHNIVVSTPRALAAPHQQVSPTPDPCAPATLTPSSNIVNIRSGPGPDYQLIGRLRAGETRPAVGRHGWYEWWQIDMGDGALGWVWDRAVIVSGDILTVPVVGDDVIPQGVSTRWEPTPSAACLATATPEALTVLSTPVSSDSTAVAELNSNDDGWSMPVSLSRSGLASEPQLVVDSSGVAHAIWREKGLEGYVYTHQVDGAWLQPLVIDVPFGVRRDSSNVQGDKGDALVTPVLVADGTGVLHAFWRNEEGALFYSQVPAASFATYAAWSTPLLLAEEALSVTATVDEEGWLHLGYIRTAETVEEAAGIYYQQSSDGSSWTEPVALYRSSYLRAVTDDKARLQIAATRQASSARVYVAWDNPLLEQVFLARSLNGGETWLEPVSVDGRTPTDRSDATGPSKVTLSALDDDVLVLWQAGHEGASCQQHYKYSEDGGGRWSEEGVLLEETTQCPEDLLLLPGDPEVTLLLATVDGRPYLLAWDGEQWSEPQYQELLSQFTDPGTFRPIAYTCYRAAHTGKQLIIVGCGSGNGTDVWTTSRVVEGVDGWYPDPESWSEPVEILSGVPPIESLDVVASEDLIHAAWTQKDASSIFYARMNSQGWSSPSVVASAKSTIYEVVFAESDGQLLLVWSGDGQIWFSAVQADRATITAEWMAPKPLAGSVRGHASNISMAVDKAGRIYVVFAIPFNEQRGIYLVRSVDRGKSWSQPTRVFDASDAGWETLSSPSLAISNDGSLHLLLHGVLLSDIPGESRLYYSYSHRQGEEWSEPAEVETGNNEGGAIVWSRMIAAGERSLHQLWQESDGMQTQTGYRSSSDGGVTWSQPRLIRRTSSTDAPITVVKGAINELYLLMAAEQQPMAPGSQTGSDTRGKVSVEQWEWVPDAERWQTIASVDIPPQQASQRMLLAAVITARGRLTLLSTSTATGTNTTSLVSTERILEAPSEASMNQLSVPTSAPNPTTQPTPAPSSTASPTNVDVEDRTSTDVSGSTLPSFPTEERNPLALLLVGIAPVLGFVLLIFAVGLRLFVYSRDHQ